MVFSDSVLNLGIVEQTRSIMRVDSNQWPTYKIVNSVNNYLDLCAAYLIASDVNFNWDDSNHTKLPEGTTDLTIAVTDYSFLTDQQGNKIMTLLGISRYDSTTAQYVPLTKVNRNDEDINLQTFGAITGIPTQYDEIADNIIRLDFKPAATVTNGLKFFFQRTPSYFAATDTTKEPGVPALLHRGFVIAAAYDGALTLGLQNLAVLGAEMQKEEAKMVQCLSGRNNDSIPRVVPAKSYTR